MESRLLPHVGGLHDDVGEKFLTSRSKLPVYVWMLIPAMSRAGCKGGEIEECISPRGDANNTSW